MIATPLPEFNRPHRAAVAHAGKAFLAELQETAAFATHKKYRLLLTKMVAFSEKRGYIMIDQWEPPDVREFRTSWAINPQTGARRMSMLKPFFEYCVANEWITRNPARLVKNPRGRDAAETGLSRNYPSPMTNWSACTMPAQNTAIRPNTSGPAINLLYC